MWWITGEDLVVDVGEVTVDTDDIEEYLEDIKSELTGANTNLGLIEAGLATVAALLGLDTIIDFFELLDDDDNQSVLASVIGALAGNLTSLLENLMPYAVLALLLSGLQSVLDGYEAGEPDLVLEFNLGEVAGDQKITLDLSFFDDLVPILRAGIVVLYCLALASSFRQYAVGNGGDDS